MIDIFKAYWKWFIAILILIIGGGIFFYLYNKNNKKEDATYYSVLAEEKDVSDNVIEEPVVQEIKMVNVDIKGAVKKPGVYSLEEGSLVNDVIKLAGLKASASTKNINLSKKVVDEMVIIVSTLKELNSMETNETKNKECVSDTVIINECAEASIIVPSNGNNEENNNSLNEEKSTKVNINKASKEELMTLSGIGESKALAIIKYREDNNSFKEISEIMNVNGIGEALFNKIKDYITV